MTGFSWIDIALIENTALKGAQIAVAYTELIKQQGTEPGPIAPIPHVRS
jgi:hypothetical protein